MLNSFKPRPKAQTAAGEDPDEDHDAQRAVLETTARKIAALPEEEILVLSRPPE